LNNLIKCRTCNKWLIIEELDLHKCQGTFKVVDLKYKWFVKSELENFGDILLVEGQDGTLYRITPVTPNFKHPNGTPRDSTEPIFLFPWE
jgi:hypothetical protein